MKQDLKQYIDLLPVRSNNSIKINSFMNDMTNFKYTDKTTRRDTYFQLKI